MASSLETSAGTRHRISTRCECQARLFADLDGAGQVLSGWAVRGEDREGAPAHSIGADDPSGRFDVGWLCPWCNRNTLRTFERSAMRRVG